MLHHKAPHRPWEPDEKHKAQFANRWIPEPPTLWDRYETRGGRDRAERAARVRRPDAERPEARRRLPASPGPPGRRGCAVKPTEVTIEVERDDRGGSPASSSTAGSTSATCGTTWRACSRWTTTSAGCSTTCARAASTGTPLVIYTSDQGFYLGEHGMYDKRFMYEESLRMPFLVRWPAGIARGLAHRRDGAQRRLRADVPRARRPARPGGHAGPQPGLRWCAGRRRRTGGRRCTTATTTTRATTTRGRTTACARRRTS